MRPQSSLILQFTFVVVLSFHWTASGETHKSFLQCLSQYSQNTSISKVIYTQNNSSYSSVLNFTIQNLRFSTPTTPKPLVIITPLQVSHIQATIKCAKRYDLQIRVRSGGHDYEGLSYISNIPFIIIDMRNLSSINIDVETKTAWVQVGATIGQFFYKIAEKSKTLSTAAGGPPTIGLGGHISGGGHGSLLRKYGLAADNIVDAHLIDVHGRLLDRKSMGEDLFWAIRGGGGASFGVIIAWKTKLVDVPSTVTVFTVQKTLEQNLTMILYKWQYVVDKLPKDLFLLVTVTSVNASIEENRTIQASFQALFLGGVDRLLLLMEEQFPELGLVKEDCIEMSWIQSILYFGGFKIGESLDVLLDRASIVSYSFKGKSDFVKEPIPIVGLEGIYKRLYKSEAATAQLFLIPHGGKMSEIPESEIPYPHRAGNIYEILHFVQWEGSGTSQRHINWIRELYDYVTPYVSKNPRAVYYNYRDLDIGRNNKNYTSYKQASVWGFKYFKNNFNRLVKVKTMVDPDNFFRNEQSIPSLSSWKKKKELNIRNSDINKYSYII